MLSLNSILTELSEERINQVAVSGIEAADGEDREFSGSRSRSGRRPVLVRRGRRARPVRRGRRRPNQGNT